MISVSILIDSSFIHKLTPDIKLFMFSDAVKGKSVKTKQNCGDILNCDQ